MFVLLYFSNVYTNQGNSIHTQSQLLHLLFPKASKLETIVQVSANDLSWHSILKGMPQGSLLVATSIDRLFRSCEMFWKVLETCKERGITLVVLLPPQRMIKPNMVTEFCKQIGMKEISDEASKWDEFINFYLNLKSNRQMIVNKF